MTMAIHPASSSASAQPRWKAIYDQLVAMLPGYTYGSNFFTIAEICEKFDVSHITARRVLTEMEQQGLVEKIRKRGTVVRRVDAKAAIYFVVPSQARPDYASYSLLMRRTIAGLTAAAQAMNVDFEVVQEAYVQSIFTRASHDVGFVLPSLISPDAIAYFKENNLPHVLLGPRDHWKQHPHVRLDHVQLGLLSTRYLIERGHRRIAYVLGLMSSRNFRDRIRGYRDALREAGIPFKWELVWETVPTEPVTPEMDFDTFEAMLAIRRPPTAVITGDKGRAMRLLNFCQQRGIDVPGKLSILCFPDFPEAKLTRPALTAMDGQYELNGQAAVKLLLEQIHNQATPARQAVVTSPLLIERQSVSDRRKADTQDVASNKKKRRR